MMMKVCVVISVDGFCKYLAWFAQHKNQLPATEQIPIIILKGPKSLIEQDVKVVKEGLVPLFYPEEVVTILVEYYRLKLQKALKKADARKNLVMNILEVLTEAIVAFNMFL
eukprot:TRINITY_DN11690_c0_g1_i2.p3 TRINITY_DN11690_c0_g1~~TRINITY_DN11690_c0_g1_i2.p3  ORF type:complete len:111 (-),score=26.71 TRINITY_DN11690_c0_g1_i2:389-721(-)